jgi:putative transposase
MPKGLKRYYGLGHLHFITCSCHGRLPLLRRAGVRDCVVRILGQVRAQYGCQVVGYVIMPEHIHLLVSEPPGVTPSSVMRSFKQRVSRELRAQRKRRVSRV